MYQAISGGIRDSADAMHVMTRVGMTAAANQAKLDDVMLAATKTMAAYSIGAKDVDRVLNALLVTVDAGQVEMPELAGAVGKVVGVAARSKIPLEEMLAILATMTQTMPNVDMAANGLAEAIRNLTAPMPEAKKFAAELGVELGDNALKNMTLTEKMKEVEAAAGGSTEKMRKMIPEVMALRGVQEALTNEGKNLAASQAMMGDGINRVELTMRNYREESRATWAQVKADVQGVAILVGDGLAPSVDSAVKQFDELAKEVLNSDDRMAQLKNDVKILAGASGLLLLVGSAGTVIIKLAELKAAAEALNLIKLGPAAAAVALIGGSAIYAASKIRELNNEMLKAASINDQNTRYTLDRQGKYWQDYAKANKGSIDPSTSAEVKRIGDELRKAASAAGELDRVKLAGLSDQAEKVTGKVKALKSSWDIVKLALASGVQLKVDTKQAMSDVTTFGGVMRSIYRNLMRPMPWQVPLPPANSTETKPGSLNGKRSSALNLDGIQLATYFGSMSDVGGGLFSGPGPLMSSGELLGLPAPEKAKASTQAKEAYLKTQELLTAEITRITSAEAKVMQQLAAARKKHAEKTIDALQQQLDRYKDQLDTLAQSRQAAEQVYAASSEEARLAMERVAFIRQAAAYPKKISDSLIKAFDYQAAQEAAEKTKADAAEKAAKLAEQAAERNAKYYEDVAEAEASILRMKKEEEAEAIKRKAAIAAVTAIAGGFIPGLGYGITSRPGAANQGNRTFKEFFNGEEQGTGAAGQKFSSIFGDHKVSLKEMTEDFNKFQLSIKEGFVRTFTEGLFEGEFHFKDFLKNLAKMAVEQEIMLNIVGGGDGKTAAGGLLGGGGLLNGLVDLVGGLFGLFDDPVNDAWARREGTRFAKFMGEGAQGAMAAAGLGAATGGGSNVFNFYNPQLSSGQNIQQVANQIARTIDRRKR
jgi:TP901 family phage tail tape measure protein